MAPTARRPSTLNALAAWFCHISYGLNPQLFILVFSNSFFSFIMNNLGSKMCFTNYVLNEKKNITIFLILKEVTMKCNLHRISVDIYQPARD